MGKFFILSSFLMEELLASYQSSVKKDDFMRMISLIGYRFAVLSAPDVFYPIQRVLPLYQSVFCQALLDGS